MPGITDSIRASLVDVKFLKPAKSESIACLFAEIVRRRISN